MGIIDRSLMWFQVGGASSPPPVQLPSRHPSCSGGLTDSQQLHFSNRGNRLQQEKGDKKNWILIKWRSYWWDQGCGCAWIFLFNHYAFMLMLSGVVYWFSASGCSWTQLCHFIPAAALSGQESLHYGMLWSHPGSINVMNSSCGHHER